MADVSLTSAQIRPLIPSLVTKGVAGAALALGQVVVLNSSEVWVVADADAASTAVGLIGIAVAGGKANPLATIASGEEVSVLLHGRVAGYSGLNGGTNYFLSGTAGKIADSAGTVSRFLGHAEDTNIFYFDPVGVATSS